MSLFPAFRVFFCTISAFSLYGEYVVCSLLPNGVLLPCDHGLDFDISLLRKNSINQSIVQQQQFSGVTFVKKKNKNKKQQQQQKKNQNAPRPASASFFVSMLSLKPRPFVQSSFDMEAFR